MLAHNGEINTIQGNRNWSLARSRKFQPRRCCRIWPRSSRWCR
jgi:glutamate synthase domain-containing protein 1